VAAAERGGRTGADQLGGGQPGPGLLDDQPGGAGPQDGRAGAVPGAGDRGFVLAERGLRRAPPGEIGVAALAGGRRLMVQEGGGDDRTGLGGFPGPVGGRGG
jgi:hypothetical protein